MFSAYLSNYYLYTNKSTMKQLKKAADGEVSLLWIILGVTVMSLIGLSAMCQTVQVRTPQELTEAITSGYNVRIMNDIDLTGVVVPPIKSTVNGGGRTVTYTKLPATGEVFLFNIDGGAIDSMNITGPNGNVYADGGYFGAVKVWSLGGRITNINFMNCDKFGIYNMGTRKSVTDSAYIANCTFTGIKRNGYGYGIWTQYGRSVVRNSVFQQGRHGVDGSSESNEYDIQYCTFTGSFYNYMIHLHAYPDGQAISGNGFVFKNNYVYGKQVPIEIYKSSTGATLFQNNYFEASTDLGKISGIPIVSDTLVWKNNKTGGAGLPVAPVITGSDTVRCGERVSFSASGYSVQVFPFGKPSVNGYASPRVKVYSCYGVKSGVRSLSAYKSITVKDTGVYTGFYLKTYKCKIEVYRDGALIQVVTSPVWKLILYRGGKLTFKVVAEPGGVCMIDDWVKNGTSETFELTNKIKIYGYQGVMKASRFIGDQSSGLWSFKFESVTGASVNVE